VYKRQLHYWANDRVGEPFWDQRRAMELPATLRAKIGQWQAAGFIHREHEELFTEVGWFQVFAGQEVAAHGYNPLADAMPEADLRALLDGTEAAMVEQVRALPRHVEVLAGLVGRVEEPVP